MLFCSREFLVFFTAVFAVYWALPWHRGRVWLLLAASFVFYASWNRWLALLLGLTSLVDYLAARGMAATTSCRVRRLLLGLSLSMNLGLLVYFKYANFFLRSLEDALQAAGAAASLPVLAVILPVGISFYTFEAINYTVDVYRRRIPATRDLGAFLLFILFFPHLIAGPIVRARDFLPQIARRKRWSWPRLSVGVRLFLLGLFKKMVVADRLALVVDPIYANPASFGSGALWLAAVGYALQVFCDFSGYSDMALGCAHMLGYKLTRNFNLPFLAPNITEFWRRWHISLSGWLRDYVFIPLGGSRGTTWQTYRNILLTMTLCGLWHGASWPYAIYGALQGGLLIGHRRFRAFCAERPLLSGLLQTSAGTVLRVATTFFVFCTTLVVFRSGTLSSVGTMLLGLFQLHEGLPARKFGLWLIWLLIGVVGVAHLAAWRGRWQRLWATTPAPVRGLALAALLTVTLLLAPEGHKTFVYFQF